MPGVPNKGWVRVTKLESCTGDASVSNRKGKRIVAFELDVKCQWKGQVDYDDHHRNLHRCTMHIKISKDVALGILAECSIAPDGHGS